MGACQQRESGEREMVSEIKEPGLVVQLRSGGPLMTVVGRDEDDRVICTYFNTKLEQVTLGLEPFLLKVDLDAVNGITVLPVVKKPETVRVGL